FFRHVAPPPAIYPLSLHDALPISTFGFERRRARFAESTQALIARNHNLSSRFARLARIARHHFANQAAIRSIVSHWLARVEPRVDRKSTRLNSSHQIISYAVFCLK